MNTIQDNIYHYHKAAGYPAQKTPILDCELATEITAYGKKTSIQQHVLERIEWLYAALNELRINTYKPNIVNMAKALIDIIHDSYAIACVIGVDIEPLLSALCASRMTKFQPCPVCRYTTKDVQEPICKTCNNTGVIPTVVKDGKVQKPENWQPPQIERLIREQHNNGKKV